MAEKWNKAIRMDGVLSFLLAVILLILPFPWILAAIAAALWHECGHAAAVILTGGRILQIHFGWNGACMETLPMSRKKAIVCTLAGPAFSLFLLALRRVFPRLAVCGLVQGIYNFLPIYPLDGWRILHNFCCLASGDDHAQKICMAADVSTKTLICVGMLLAAFFLRLGLIPALSVILFLCSRKIPCKDGLHRVQ